ncbi:MAG: hypothetical protein AAGA20_24660 [Planctomycetota bacterium]
MSIPGPNARTITSAAAPAPPTTRSKDGGILANSRSSAEPVRANARESPCPRIAAEGAKSASAAKVTPNDARRGAMNSDISAANGRVWATVTSIL